MARYDPTAKDLASRDVVSRAMTMEAPAGGWPLRRAQRLGRCVRAAASGRAASPAQAPSRASASVAAAGSAAAKPC